MKLEPNFTVYDARMMSPLVRSIYAAALCLLAACSPQRDPVVDTPHPILFVTQVPPLNDDASRLSAFANHLPDVDRAPRGGALMLRTPDGRLRNLTQEAGWGNEGAQGANAIAVREPSVHWSGTKALFSMVVGTATDPLTGHAPRWQLWEVTGLGPGEATRLQRVEQQPAQYNNVSGVYGSDDQVIFTSDRPRNGQAHLHPQLDEYEGMPSISGLWSLDRTRGSLQLLSHTVSGAFTPIVDSYGRILFTRWDHLQQDRLAERDRNAQHNGVALPFGSFNYAHEGAQAQRTPSRDEVFPESGAGSDSAYGPVNAFISNFFTLWQINQDGTGEETLNHVGQHELAFGYLTPSFRDDPNLSNRTSDAFHANRVPLRREGGLFQAREDPMRPGHYVAISARESDAFTTDRIVSLSGAPTLQGEQMVLTELTAGDPGDHLRQGRYRNPLPLSDGSLLASHTSTQRAPEPGNRLADLRLRKLLRAASGLYEPGPMLTSGLSVNVNWKSGTQQRQYNGPLWEIDAVEVVPRTRPTPAPVALEPPERSVLAQAQVDENELRAWLRQQNLALIVTRDQTSRDRADHQQPFNLRVPGGVQTTSRDTPGGRLYDISHLQIFQGNLTRAYQDRPGRRTLAQPLKSVRIAPDGSTAAFVPAGRALTWQTTDPQGNAIVRERNWITFQAGEIRVCAACHGVNSTNQAGAPPPTQPPAALHDLLQQWKALPKP